MNSLYQSLEAVTRDLDAAGQPWALVGAIGRGCADRVRATLNIDVLICRLP